MPKVHRLPAAWWQSDRVFGRLRAVAADRRVDLLLPTHEQAFARLGKALSWHCGLTLDYLRGKPEYPALRGIDLGSA